MASPRTNLQAGLSDRSKRILLVADETFRMDDFLTEIRDQELTESRVQVFVVAPALARSALDQAAVDIDHSIHEARRRLNQVLAELKRAGISATGIVGDTDPVMAVGDGLRTFEADEIVVVAHTEDGAEYAERDLWKRLRDSFGVPVSAMLVSRPKPRNGQGTLVETKRNPLAKGRAPAWAQNGRVETGREGTGKNRRALFALFYSLLGTVALGFLAIRAAIDAGITAGEDFSGALITLFLVTLGAFLVTLAHNVSLLVFMSVEYEGAWEKLISRGAIAITTACLLAAVIIFFFLL